MKFKKTFFVPSFTDQGKIYTRYHELENIFGKPFYGPGLEQKNAPSDPSFYRATCQWRIQFEDGTVALIYDNRQSQTPMGMYQWFVGGLTARSYELVNQTLQEYQKNKLANAD